MAGAGLGRVVALIAVGEDHALGQALEAAVEMLAILGEQVGRELIDRDGDDQLRRFGGAAAAAAAARGRASRAASRAIFMSIPL